MTKRKYVEGSIFNSTKYGPFEIVEYVNGKKILIRFLQTGYEYWTSNSKIVGDGVRDKSTSRVFGVGIVDVDYIVEQWNGGNRIGAFTDEAVECLKKKPKKIIPIADKILPQRKRVITLTQQMVDLVQEYKSGKMTIEEYTLLLSVVSARRTRAEILLAKAKSVRAPFEIEDEEAISLGKTHVKSEKSFKTSKGTATERNRFKEGCFPTENPKKSSNSFSLSKVADWINNHQFTYFVVCSTIALTAAKLVF